MPFQPSPLDKLRKLQSLGNHKELEMYLLELEGMGYPSPILDCFRTSNISSTVHPYCYSWHENTRNLGQVSKSPLVSIIIVSYNSTADLNRLFPSLLEQSYVHWELVLIENGYADTYSLASSFFDEFTYFRAPNPGFAEANNIGLEHALGELLLLLNPDTELQPESLRQLVHGISIDSSAAAACPLIYFATPFHKLIFSSPDGQPFRLDLAPIFSCLEYKKVFTLEGTRDGATTFVSDARNRVALDIPLDPAMEQIRFDVLTDLTSGNQQALLVDFEDSGEQLQLFTIHESQQSIVVRLTKRIHSSARYLINNAGSGLREESFQVYDIGFGEVDVGQYANRAYRDAFCGCCVLLRRDLFIKRKIFTTECFAYYEDSELSHWIRTNSMNILYIPSSIIYHRHSESMAEGSYLRSLLVERGYAIYSQFRSLSSSFELPDFSQRVDNVSSDISAPLSSLLAAYDQSLNGKNSAEAIDNQEGPVVGIYNSYWNSMGGGEKHALDFARIALEQGLTVYLLSEEPFSITDLGTYFGLDLRGARKLVTGCISESLTQRFDIFVNSTYLSQLRSFATKSYYIVSFPARMADPSFLNSYTFVHNSSFTRDWAFRYWGEHRANVVLPVLSFAEEIFEEIYPALIVDNSLARKRHCILSVGRFNYSGHCKNQHVIAQVFAFLSAEGLVDSRWKLVIAGSVNHQDTLSVGHYRHTCEILQGCNAEVVANIEREPLADLYRQSALYVHAAGLGVDVEESPEKCEHFGISVFEALVHGCVPIVHRSGGPAFQVAGLQDSFLYHDFEGLGLCLREATRIWQDLVPEQHLLVAQRISSHARKQRQQSVASAERLMRP
jgi:GT2 family glycosyltransferase